VTKFVTIILVATKAAAKLEILFNKRASDNYVCETLVSLSLSALMLVWRGEERGERREGRGERGGGCIIGPV